jgi:two-component system nitrogen regulation response regulator NtrX
MIRAASAIGQPPRAFAEDSIASLQSYDWPGNERELRNIVERLLILAPGDVSQPIRADNLPPEIGAAAPISRGWERGAEIMGLPLREARENFEREYLLAQISPLGELSTGVQRLGATLLSQPWARRSVRFSTQIRRAFSGAAVR